MYKTPETFLNNKIENRNMRKIVGAMVLLSVLGCGKKPPEQKGVWNNEKFIPITDTIKDRDDLKRLWIDGVNSGRVLIVVDTKEDGIKKTARLYYDRGAIQPWQDYVIVYAPDSIFAINIEDTNLIEFEFMLKYRLDGNFIIINPNGSCVASQQITEIDKKKK